jgi:Rieske 2Fe-2S family protein
MGAKHAESRAHPQPGLALQKTLPSRYYISRKIYARELKHIFCSEWLCVGREEALAGPGSYLLLDVVGESVLVVRGKTGGLKAFYNVCRHRGSRLCSASASPCDIPSASGEFPGAIRCSYHSWTYGLDGRLLSAPHLRESDRFSREDFPLYPVGLETWGGFVFLNLTPAEAEARGHTLMEQLGPAAERVRRYPLRDLRSARRIVYDVEANWKVLAENYNECYHCGPVHPELCEVVPAFKKDGGAGLGWEQGVPLKKGAFTFTRTGTTNRAPFPGLSEEEKVRHKGEILYPNFLISLSAEHVAAFILWPAGPQRTRITCDFLFHPAEMARPGFDPSDAVEFWDLINRQDWAICESVQRGMRSRVHRFGYYAPMEDQSLDIRRYVRKRLGRRAAG